MLDEAERKLLEELNANIESIDADVKSLRLNQYKLLDLITSLSLRLDNIENRGYE